MFSINDFSKYPHLINSSKLAIFPWKRFRSHLEKLSTSRDFGVTIKSVTLKEGDNLDNLNNKEQDVQVGAF